MYIIIIIIIIIIIVSIVARYVRSWFFPDVSIVTLDWVTRI